jgi:hypothetical protein
MAGSSLALVSSIVQRANSPLNCVCFLDFCLQAQYIGDQVTFPGPLFFLSHKQQAGGWAHRRQAVIKYDYYFIGYNPIKCYKRIRKDKQK